MLDVAKPFAWTLVVLASLVCATACADADDEAEWKRLDTTSDGWLDGKELEGGWIKFDADGNGKVTKAEFLAGREKERGAAMPAPAVMSKDRIVGLFYMQKYWVATRHLEKAVWYFAPNGKVYLNPESGFAAADLEAAKTGKGTFEVSDGKMAVTWPEDAGPKTFSEIELVPGGFNWDTGMYLPIKPFANAKQIVGGYEGGTSMTFSGSASTVVKTLELREGGTFKSEGIATFVTDGRITGAESATTGTWDLSGYSLRLTAEGKVLQGIAFPFDDETTEIFPDRLYFAGVMYKKK